LKKLIIGTGLVDTSDSAHPRRVRTLKIAEKIGFIIKTNESVALWSASLVAITLETARLLAYQLNLAVEKKRELYAYTGQGFLDQAKIICGEMSLWLNKTDVMILLTVPEIAY